MSVKITKDNLPGLSHRVATLTRKQVLVGVPDTNADRNNADGQPITNAGLAYLHETGVPEKNLPARPFLLPGIKSVEKELIAILKKGGTSVVSGNLNAVDQMFNAAGTLAQSAVRNKITEGPFAPLSPVTVAARLRKNPGATEIRPLIDTGQLRRSINYVIRDRKK